MRRTLLDSLRSVSHLGLVAAISCTSPERVSPKGRAASSAPDATAEGARAPKDDALATAAGESFLLRTWSFSTRDTSFRLVDLAMHGSLVEALGPDGRAAINAGFFDPEGRAIGLAVSDGQLLSKFSSTMSGGVFYTVDGVAHVDATEEFDPTRRVDVAVQCRPRLVVHGHANVRSDDGQRAARTALCVREGGKTVDVVVAEPSPGTHGPSLYALGQLLAEQRHCDDALNLDGGPSTGVAYREGDSGASPRVLPSRGPLRYALVLR